MMPNTGNTVTNKLPNVINVLDMWDIQTAKYPNATGELTVFEDGIVLFNGAHDIKSQETEYTAKILKSIIINEGYNPIMSKVSLANNGRTSGKLWINNDSGYSLSYNNHNSINLHIEDMESDSLNYVCWNCDCNCSRSRKKPIRAILWRWFFQTQR